MLAVLWFFYHEMPSNLQKRWYLLVRRTLLCPTFCVRQRSTKGFIFFLFHFSYSIEFHKLNQNPKHLDDQNCIIWRQLPWCQCLNYIKITLVKAVQTKDLDSKVSIKCHLSRYIFAESSFSRCWASCDSNENFLRRFVITTAFTREVLLQHFKYLFN